MKSDRGWLIYPKQIKREVGAKIIYDATVIWDAIEVGLSGLPLRNVLWNCAAVPEGFAVWLCSVALLWDVRIVRILDFAL